MEIGSAILEKWGNEHSSLPSPLYEIFTWIPPPGPYRVTTSREKELTLDHTLFDHTRRWRVSPDEWPAKRWVHLRERTTRTWKMIHTITHPFSLTRRIWKDDYDGQMIFGDLLGVRLPAFVLQVCENPEKTSPRKLAPTEDRTWVRCVTDTHASTCSTAVDGNKHT